jgi:hypothetical protein
MFKFLNKNFLFFLFIFFLTLNVNNINALFSLEKNKFNLSDILNKKNNLFFDENIYVKFENQGQNQRDFIFIDKKGSIFLYESKNDHSTKIFDLRAIEFKDLKKRNKYIFEEIRIFQIDSNNFLIALYNKIYKFSLLKDNDKINFFLNWVYNSSSKINLDSILYDEKNIYFSKVNENIKSIKINDASPNWFFENSVLRNTKIDSSPILFFHENFLYSFFSNGKIIVFNKNNGEAVNNFNISEKISTGNGKLFFYPLGFDSYQSRKNLINKNIVILGNEKQYIFNLQDNKIIYEFNQDQPRFQKVFYLNNSIFTIYRNKFLTKITIKKDEMNNNKFSFANFDIPYNILDIDLKKKIKANFLKNNDYFFYSPKVFFISKDDKNFLMFFRASKQLKYFYFDIEKGFFFK